MTQRTRTRTPRRIKSWANSELITESLGSNARQLHDVLGGYYTGRGVTSVPGVTVMRIIGQIGVKSNAAGGNVDVHFGFRIADKDADLAAFPVPYLDDADWLWQGRVNDDNFITWNGTLTVVNHHMIPLDVGSRRRLRTVDDRLFLFTFNSDATDTIRTTLSTRTLLALP